MSCHINHWAALKNEPQKYLVFRESDYKKVCLIYSPLLLIKHFLLMCISEEPSSILGTLYTGIINGDSEQEVEVGTPELRLEVKGKPELRSACSKKWQI